MAARILNGFFSAPTQATGLMIVRDTYFFHQQVRMTNIWSGFFILSPYLGPGEMVILGYGTRLMCLSRQSSLLLFLALILKM